MEIDNLKMYIIGFIMLTFVGGIGAIALTSFADSDTVSPYIHGSCTENITTGCGMDYNISHHGLRGVSNTTDQFPTAGTILGVALLLGIVFGAFYMLQGRQQ